MSNLTINGKPGFPHLNTLPSPVILFSLRQHLQMKYGFTHKKSLQFTKKVRTKGRATFTDKNKEIKLIATYKNGLYFLDKKTTKKSDKKPKSSTKWKKTSTALKGMAAADEGLEFLHLHSKEAVNIKKKTKEPFPLGKYLKELRERKGVSLKKVEDDTGISNAYLSQLETGKRRRLPTPERLRILADYFGVSIQQLLEKAGYFKEGEVGETYEQKIEKAFLHIINNPTLNYGVHLNGIKDKLNLDTKRFIVEMYERATKNIPKMDDPEVCQSTKPCIGEFIVIVIDDSLPSSDRYADKVITEVMDFGTLKEAKRIAREIASDYGCTLKNLYKKRGISISIWKWTEERYLQLEIYT